MKNLFILVLLCFAISTFAQQDTCLWLKTNAKWTYSAWSVCSPRDIIGVEVIGDTLIGARLCSILGTDNSGEFIEGSELIIFYDGLDEKVYFNEDAEFKLLYDFSLSLQPGDTIEYFIPNNWEQYNISETSGILPEDRSDKYLFVDEEWVSLPNDEQLRIARVSPVVNEFDNGCVNMVRIINGVGSGNGFLGRPCLGLPSGCGEFFRCFESSTMEYKEVDEDCVTTNTSTNDINNSSIQIFPNPTSSILNIQSDQGDILRVRLYSSLGQIMLDQSVHNTEIEISVNGFTPGIYWLDVALLNGSQNREKVLVLNGE